MNNSDLTIDCKVCPYWDETGIITKDHDGEVRMCLKHDIPVGENEGCSVENKWCF